MAYVTTKIKKASIRLGILTDEVIELINHYPKKGYPKGFRRIKYFDKTNDRELVFLTNDANIKGLTISRLYKERWNVELFFKWIKQNLRIKKFHGNNENAVKVQIWIAVCDYLIIAILKNI